MKVRALAVAVFRSLATQSSSGPAGADVGGVPDLLVEVSLNAAQGALVDRERFDDAVTLLVRSKLVDSRELRLRLTPEGEQFWSRVAHLDPSGMKKWVREAVDVYSRGEELRWVTPDEDWSDAQVLLQDRQRSRMAARLEVLDGLLRALENWHLVSTLIGSAADRSGAVAALQGSPFRFTKIQAHHVVDTRLSQRTALGRLSLAEERDAIRAELDGIAQTEPRVPAFIERLALPGVAVPEDMPARSRVAS